MDKKPYNPPTVTEHGNAVKQTTGIGGKYWELYAPRTTPDVKTDD